MKKVIKLSNITAALKNNAGELEIRQLDDFITLSPKQVKELFDFYFKDKKED